MNRALFKFHNRDVREFREILQSYGCSEEFIDVTITSPPYHDLKTYGYENQIGYGQEFPDYLAALERIFKDILDLTTSTGSLWLIVDTFSRGKKLVQLPFKLAERLKKIGWILVDMNIWKKDKTLPWRKEGQLRNIFEYILFFAKSSSFKFYADRIRVPDISQLKEWWVKYPERYNPKGALPTNVWEYPIPTQGSWSNKSLRHSNPLPPKMVERILLLTTDDRDVVLDPFAGSGTVLAVADFMDRRWFGFEMSKEFCNMFDKDFLKEVREELFINKKREDELKALRSSFEEKIKNLRLVKFPKSLIRELYRRKILDIDRIPINTVFVVSREPTEEELSEMPENEFMLEDIFFVFDSDIKTEVLKEGINEVISKPPLSKFGIEPTVFLHQKDEFVSQHRNTFNDINLWLYAYGVVYRFEKQMDFSHWITENTEPRWAAYVGNGIPPIISNVQVNQKIPKTWKSREEKFNILKERYEKALGMN